MADKNIVIPDDITDAVIDKNKYVVVNAPNATKIVTNTSTVEGGLPKGGTTNQILAKSSDEDYAVEWVDNEGGGGGDTPTYYNFNITALAGGSGQLTNLTQEEIYALNNTPEQTRIIWTDSEDAGEVVAAMSNLRAAPGIPAVRCLYYIGREVLDGITNLKYGVIDYTVNYNVPYFFYVQLELLDFYYSTGNLELVYNGGK